MAVKIRLKRMGATKRPYYRIVVADSRAKREGNEYVAKVYNDLYYAGWIEFGHRQVAGGRFIRFIPGGYMLTNATEQTENEAVEIVDSILGKYLLEVFK